MEILIEIIGSIILEGLFYILVPAFTSSRILKTKRFDGLKNKNKFLNYLIKSILFLIVLTIIVILPIVLIALSIINDDRIIKTLLISSTIIYIIILIGVNIKRYKNKNDDY